MLDHAFQRRREIERMLLPGKRLTVPKLMAMYSVGKNAIRRDFEVIGEELPVIAKQGYNGGYFLMDGAVSSYIPPLLIAEGHLEVCFLAKRNGGLDYSKPPKKSAVQESVQNPLPFSGFFLFPAVEADV